MPDDGGHAVCHAGHLGIERLGFCGGGSVSRAKLMSHGSDVNRPQFPPPRRRKRNHERRLSSESEPQEGLAFQSNAANGAHPRRIRAANDVRHINIELGPGLN
jgi:hypothetical protein